MVTIRTGIFLNRQVTYPSCIFGEYISKLKSATFLHMQVEIYYEKSLQKDELYSIVTVRNYLSYAST